MDSWVAGGVLLQYFALSTISFPDDICSNFSDHPLIIEIILRQHEIFPNKNILYKTCPLRLVIQARLVFVSSSSHTFPVLRTNPEAPFSHGSKMANLSTNERRAFPHGGKSQPPHPSQNVCSQHISAQPSESTTP